MTLRNLLLFIHLTAAFVWVGGALMLVFLNARANRSGDSTQVIRMAANNEFSGRVVFNTSGVITLLAGVGLVLESDVWGFSMGWIIFAIVVVIASAILGMAFYAPQLRAVMEIVDENGPDDPDLAPRLRRIAVVFNIEVLFLIAVVFAMVFKPGA